MEPPTGVTQLELGWLAGILEGEGSFAAYAHNQGHVALRISIKSIDRDVLDRLADTVMGCRINGPYNHKSNKLGKHPIYVLTLYGPAAEELMRMLYPLMSERRKAQIRDAILKRRTYENERKWSRGPGSWRSKQEVDPDASEILEDAGTGDKSITH